MAADFGRFLEDISSSPGYAGQLVHVEEIPAREAVYGELSEPLPEPLWEALTGLGIDRLYSHQTQAIEHLREGSHTAVVTGTASGKTLCYNLPVLERLLAHPEAKALYLFPTKALAQDQMRGLRRLADSHPDLASLVRCGTYDGDTPAATRRKLRREANVIMSNPDMLHQGILPYHSRWGSFFADLNFVVVDEIHTYRGIFGSNVANVLRRLRRVCDHYGASPTFVCCSATIANPGELAARLIGQPVTLVDEDASPRGPKRFVLWNPPHLDTAKMERQSSNEEARRLLVSLLRQKIQTIAFARTRIVAELLYKYTAESLDKLNSLLADAVRPYRAGYLPEERREIEQRLFSGELLGVTSTNALELGIDVGSLDASVIVGYPGTIASTWQQAGRAGRGREESLVVLVGYNEPLDQFLMLRPDHLFGRSPEHAVIDPENPYLLAGHLRCAAFELPLRASDASHFGEQALSILEILEDLGQLSRIDDTWYWATTEYPAAQVALRTQSDDTYTIMDTSDGNRVIGMVDAISAPETVYPGGVYLHEGDTHLVRELDLEARCAYVERRQVDYYTQAILDSSIRAGVVDAEKDWAGGRLFFGDATVTWQTTAFKKIKFYTQENIGYSRLDLPAQHLETDSCWFVPSQQALALVSKHGRKPLEGLVGIRNVAVNMLPLIAMCDRLDVGGIVDSTNLGTPTMFLYDRYPGGLGFAEKGYGLFQQLMEECLSTIERCPCEEGCPSCVGLPVTQPAQQMDPDLGRGYPIPDKEAALVLLCQFLEREPYIPRRRRRSRREPAQSKMQSPRADQERDVPKSVSVSEQVAQRLRRTRRPHVGL
ncbi:MAG: DEAD/DEAH box helicase [Armatimonadetes bacterium]|nr:DEAD/DEAH box helicase [Armatimonadota bacterium]